MIKDGRYRAAFHSREGWSRELQASKTAHGDLQHHLCHGPSCVPGPNSRPSCHSSSTCSWAATSTGLTARGPLTDCTQSSTFLLPRNPALLPGRCGQMLERCWTQDGAVDQYLVSPSAAARYGAVTRGGESTATCSCVYPTEALPENGELMWRGEGFVPSATEKNKHSAAGQVASIYMQFCQ